MAKYTTELRDVVESGVKLFDFEYEFYDPTKKSDFEQRFIDHFYFREIGQETVGRFQHYLKCKCYEVLPYYNEVLKAAQLEYDILQNYDMLETLEKTTDNTRALNENIDHEANTDASTSTTGEVDRTVTGNQNTDKTNTLKSISQHHDETTRSQNEEVNETGNTARNEDMTETGKLDKTSTQVIDGKKVSSDTPNGLLSMEDIKNDVYASRADIEDTTNTATDAQTTEGNRTNTTTEDKTANKQGTTTETAATDVTDGVDATNTDISNTETTEAGHEENTANTNTDTQTTTETDRTQNETNNTNENYTLKRTGNIGVMHATDMIEKHVALQRKIRTVYSQFFGECEDLFMMIF